MTYASELVPKKWYASKAFKVGRGSGSGIDPEYINLGIHHTVLSPPFDNKHEVEQWAEESYDGSDDLYIWQFHGWTKRKE